MNNTPQKAAVCLFIIALMLFAGMAVLCSEPQIKAWVKKEVRGQEITIERLSHAEVKVDRENETASFTYNYYCFQLDTPPDSERYLSYAYDDPTYRRYIRMRKERIGPNWSEKGFPTLHPLVGNIKPGEERKVLMVFIPLDENGAPLYELVPAEKEKSKCER